MTELDQDTTPTSVEDKTTASVERGTSPPRLLRLPEVCARVGIQRTAVYSKIKSGQFPQPVKVGRQSGWLESEITDWIEVLGASRPAGLAP